jgi:hypothetical protein
VTDKKTDYTRIREALETLLKHVDFPDGPQPDTRQVWEAVPEYVLLDARQALLDTDWRTEPIEQLAQALRDAQEEQIQLLAFLKSVGYDLVKIS